MFTEDVSTAKRLKRRNELNDYCSNLLSQLNSGGYIPKDAKELFNLLEVASKQPLDDSYYAYAFCIENIVRKYQRKSNSEIIRSMFESAVFNTRLVSGLSEHSLERMRSRYTIAKRVNENEKTIFKVGERNLFVLFFENWLEANETSRIYIMDPYFHVTDIEILKTIKKIKPDVEVFIITTKKAVKDIDDYHQGYSASWHKTCVESPPDTVIKIIWLEGSDIPPFHDRYVILDSCGIKPGHSIGEIGKVSDSGLSHLTGQDFEQAKDIVVNDYYTGMKKEHNSLRIKHTSFSL